MEEVQKEVLRELENYIDLEYGTGVGYEIIMKFYNIQSEKLEQRIAQLNEHILIQEQQLNSEKQRQQTL